MASRNGQIFKSKIFWAFFCQEQRRGSRDTSLRNGTRVLFWPCLLKRRVRVSSVSGTVPSAAGKDVECAGEVWADVQVCGPGSSTIPLLGRTPTSCHLSLAVLMETGFRRWRVVSWFPAAENNKCLVTNKCDEKRLLLGAMDWCQGGQLWTKPPTSNLYNSIGT